jgi:hypothetical protein
MSESRRSKARKDARRQSKARKDARKQLEARWKANCRPSAEGWPPTPLDLEGRGENSANLNTFDPLGNPITMAVSGKRMWIAPRVIVRYCIELGNKVRGWKNKKEVSGEDVMEILEIALMLTNDPAYAAARKAMIRHRIDIGGLKRGLLNLHRRHHEPPERFCTERISWYLKEGYSLREAAEHVVADEGIPGNSFLDAVDKVRKAYAKREQHEAERQQYLHELGGPSYVDDSG